MLKSAPADFTLDNFALGLDWASPPDRLNAMSVYDAKNINLTSFKALEKRSGMAKFYATPYVSGQRVLDIYEFPGPEDTKILVACNSATDSRIGYYDSGWHDLKTGLTHGARYYFATHNEYCFVTNGEDDNFKIRGTDVYNVGIEPPAAAPEIDNGALSGLSGKYRYVYCYKRSTDIGPEHRSDPSPESDDITVTAGSIKLSLIASTDPQVDEIEIYRSLDFSSADESGLYYLVTTVENATQDYDDAAQDDDLTTVCLTTNGVPPKSYFCKLHKDRMIYANCPDETDGDSLFMFSEIGRPESCPGINYQYFDRKDGQEITGLASLPDYLVVFKKNKMAAVEGDFIKWYTISSTTGCIAPWAITTFQDLVMFLSAEGWKVTDGRSVQDVSKRLMTLNRSQYISYIERKNYAAAYYPTRKQALFLMNHSSYTKMIMVGHLLSALYSDVTTENSVDEPYIGWTYHQYQYHTLSALGRYTDANGVEKVLAGDETGFIYELDTGTQDDGYNIAWAIETGWQTLNTPLPLTKQMRIINVVYGSNVAYGATQDEQGDSPGTVLLTVDVDYVNDIDTMYLKYGTSSYCGYVYCNEAYPGLVGVYTENLPLSDKCNGRKFRFRLSDTSGYDFTLMSIAAMFRLAGLREGVL